MRKTNFALKPLLYKNQTVEMLKKILLFGNILCMQYTAP